VRSQIDQNPQTKEVLVVVAAAPDKTPPKRLLFSCDPDEQYLAAYSARKSGGRN